MAIKKSPDEKFPREQKETMAGDALQGMPRPASKIP